MMLIKRLALITVLIAAAAFSSSLVSAREDNIVKLYKDVEIAKDSVVNDVVVIGGNVTVMGRIENSIVAVGGSVSLKEHSYVGEDVVVVGGDVTRDPSAIVKGRVTQVYMPSFLPSLATLLHGGWVALWATISVLALIGLLGLAVLLVALIPEHIGATVSAIERSPVMMFLWGVLWTILIVPIAVLLAISIVGIILIPLEIMFVVLALIIGYIASAIYIGRNILLAFKKPPPPFVDAALGIVILFLVSLIPVAGMMIKLFFVIAGFGAVLNTRFGTVK
jgi:carbonic anhydrase/acetyltransferase-like protein (isoleucine patch superfamily)